MNEPQQTVAPTETPISLGDARAVCRLTGHQQDGELQDWIDLAADRLQAITWRQFCTATYTLNFDRFDTELALPRPPLASVSSIKYYDLSSVQQTLSTDIYEAITDRTPGIVRLKYHESWPSVRGHPDDIIITFICGQAAGDLPIWAKQAVKFLVAHYYEFGPAAETPSGVLALLDRVGAAV